MYEFDNNNNNNKNNNNNNSNNSNKYKYKYTPYIHPENLPLCKNYMSIKHINKAFDSTVTVNAQCSQALSRFGNSSAVLTLHSRLREVFDFLFARLCSLVTIFIHRINSN